MSRPERRRIAHRRYRACRDLPVWELVGMENQGLLNWRFRPRYIDVRVKRAIQDIWKEAALAELERPYLTPEGAAGGAGTWEEMPMPTSLIQ